MRNRKTGVLLIGAALPAILLGGFAGGNAFASSIAATGHSSSATRLVAAEPSYAVNAAGQTYGSALQATSPDNEPDLILVVSDSGVEGYAKKVDLDAASGAAAAETFKTPQDALAWQQKRQTLGVEKVAVYKADGHSAVGEFTLAASVPQTVPSN